MSIKKKYSFYKERIKSGRLKQMKEETIWIYQYAKKYRRVTVFYTVLGLCSSLIGIVSAFISKDLVDIITGHKTGEVIRTFMIMIGVSLFNIMLSQLIGYLSNKISMNVEAQIKSDIFEKILKTEWESLSKYHTGDLLSRWSSDASMIANGVLSFLPNLIINIFKFISAFAVVVYNDWTFALFALAGIPVSLLFSKKIMTRMQNNNRRSAQMSAR
ncbi:MAG: ABC transporter ATP-binding protein, partial [Erysipelotrichaceae bacterium]|nr:ABC transporter ATP-binding protein [Erysipelotrichaceae bacterium]